MRELTTQKFFSFYPFVSCIIAIFIHFLGFVFFCFCSFFLFFTFFQIKKKIIHTKAFLEMFVDSWDFGKMGLRRLLTSQKLTSFDPFVTCIIVILIHFLGFVLFFLSLFPFFVVLG